MNVSPSKAKKRALGLLRENRRGRSWRVIAHEVFRDQINYATLNRFATSKGTWLPKDENILIVLELVKPRKPKPPKPPLEPWQKEVKAKIAGLARQTRESVLLVKHE